MGVPHLEIKAEGLDLSRRYIPHFPVISTFNFVLIMHQLETLTNFGSEDLSGDLTHNGLARGVWILLRHFTNV